MSTRPPAGGGAPQRTSSLVYEPATASACGATGGGASSSVIVPVAVGVASIALVAFDSRSVKVSSSSAALSPVVATLTVFDLWPAVKVSAPLAAVKSPAPALSPGSADAAQSTVTSRPLAGDSRTVNSTGSPSVACASPTLTTGTSLASITTRPGRPGFWIRASVSFRRTSQTWKSSRSSSAPSSMSGTVIVCRCAPGPNVSVPVVRR